MPADAHGYYTNQSHSKLTNKTVLQKTFKWGLTVLQSTPLVLLVLPQNPLQASHDHRYVSSHSPSSLMLSDSQIMILPRSWKERNSASPTCLPWKRALSGGWQAGKQLACSPVRHSLYSNYHQQHSRDNPTQSLYLTTALLILNTQTQTHRED